MIFYTDRVKVGDVVRVRSKRDGKINALEKRDGLKCHYCHHPLSKLYNRCIAIEYHPHRWYRPNYGDQHPGYYPVFEPFLLEGCKLVELDHKLPRCMGGTNHIDNLVLCCPECNAAKSSRYSYEQFMKMTAVARP